MSADGESLAIAATRAALVVAGAGIATLDTEVDLDPWWTGQRSPNTSRAYQRDWLDFQGWCVRQGLTTLRQVTIGLLTEYRNTLRQQANARTGQPYTTATISRKLVAVRQALDYAVAAGALPNNPARVLKGYRVPNISPRVALERHQVRALLAQPDGATLLGLRDRAILHLLLYLGLRRDEVARLTRRCLGSEQGYTTLYVLGKGDKDRLLPVPPVAVEAVRAYLAASDAQAHILGLPSGPETPLFRPTSNNRYGGDVSGHISADLVLRRVQHYARRAGVSVAHLDAHTMRVTSLTQALANGADPLAVRDMAGHADLRTTLRYDKRRKGLHESAVHAVVY